MSALPLPPAHRFPTWRRWWTYQSERFPVVGHGMLIAAFSFCAVSFSAQLRGERAVPPVLELAVAFATCFVLFLQLRIADEFKDFEEDARFRPYRPVQRGLVSLKELAALFVAGAVIQGVMALWLDPRLMWVLLLVWVYLAAMSKEFLIGGWLRSQPLLYMLSHMVIIPLVDLYATSTDWLPRRGGPPAGLIWFLMASYCNGMVIELGRKIRSPQDEEYGVGTYSVLWGRRLAVAAWLGAMAGAGALAVVAASQVGMAILVMSTLAVGLSGAAAIGIWFLRSQRAGSGKMLEGASGTWTVLMYLSLGAVPLLVGR
jgi:4-hydroxybenzoate polyprenyltransferase